MKIGDKVKWKSQSGGSITEKAGVIVYVLTRETTPYRLADKHFPNHSKMFDGANIPGKGDVAYFVEVETGPKAKPRLYMPYPSKLELSEDK